MLLVVTVTMNATNSTCSLGKAGSLSFSAAGGSEIGFTYYVNDVFFNTTTELDSLGPGTYSVMAKDSNQCASAATTVLLSDPSGMYLAFWV